MSCRTCPYFELDLGARFGLWHFERGETLDLTAGADPGRFMQHDKVAKNVPSMATWVTPFSSSQARKAARSWRMAPKLRTSLLGRRPAALTMTQATTEPWCTSSPAACSMIASITTSNNKGGRRSAAGRKTEAGPRAGRTSRPRPSVIPEHGTDRSLPRGRMPPTHYRPPRVRQPACWKRRAPFHCGPIFSSKAVRNTRWASLQLAP